PTFLPIMPLTIFFSSCKGYWLAAHVTANVTPRETRASCKLLQLDLDVHASGELEAHQGLHRLIGRLQNVDQALVGAALELLAAVLVLVGRTQDGDHLTVDRKSTRLNSSHVSISYAVFCLIKKNKYLSKDINRK